MRKTKEIWFKEWSINKYKFKLDNVIGLKLDVYRNNSQFGFIQFDRMFHRHFFVLCYRNNIGFRFKNKDLPRWIFPRWQLADDWKKALEKHVQGKRIKGFIGNLEGIGDTKNGT